MDTLVEGYRRFRVESWPAERDRYQALAIEGQRPEALVIACSDSRVDPQTVFGAVPGQLFVVRNVAGLVPPYSPDAGYHGTSAALEYGVRVLGVDRVVVLGHARCGGVRAMLDGAPALARDFVAPWMEIARAALPERRDLPFPQLLRACEEAVVRLSLGNLLTFPWIATPVAAGTLRLEGFRFNIRTGGLSRLDGENFVAVT